MKVATKQEVIVNPQAILQEQLALQRLRQIQAAQPPPRPEWWAWIAGVFRAPKLVREIGPGKRPADLYEWERREYRPIL